MIVVTLAAGLGNRLGPLTTDIPKALVQVAGRELILHLASFLDSPRVSKWIIVAGYQADRLATFVREHRLPAEVILNSHYRDGSIRSIEAALPHLDDDFLVTNVDHIYPKRMFDALVQNNHALQAICDFDRMLGEDDMKVALHSNGTLKAIHKKLPTWDAGYIGMTMVKKTGLARYKEAVHQTRRQFGDAAPVEWALGLLAEHNTGVGICDASGFGWLEVDTPEDRMHAEAKLNLTGKVLP
ncbi:MAG: NTP transferase domain-containing protein [Deltaproteobacteria bacterium]|nr:NTP transferase domain-containing protein [Deltaproteobacteria bacterium]